LQRKRLILMQGAEFAWNRQDLERN